MTNKKNSKLYLKIFLCLLPALLIYTYIIVVPIIRAVYYSNFNWSGGDLMKYVGIKNYQILMKDRQFWNSFKNNIIITLLCIVGQIGLAFIFACMLNTRFMKLKAFHRVVSFFPSTISSVVVGFVWMFIFNYDYGLLNTFLRSIGAGNAVKAWLDDPKTVIYIVSIPLIWQYIGYYMTILLSAMTSIDHSIYEAAELDGATGVQQATKITFPLIRHSIAVTIILCIAGNMKIFDHIYVMTNGGPGTSSMVVALDIYKTTFIKNRYGYASAMSVTVMVLSLVLVGGVKLIENRISRKEQMQQ